MKMYFVRATNCMSIASKIIYVKSFKYPRIIFLKYNKITNIVILYLSILIQIKISTYKKKLLFYKTKIKLIETFKIKF